MRLSLLAAFLIALMTLPAEAARPVKGAVQGTATAATGIAKGAGQAGVGVVREARQQQCEEPPEDFAASNARQSLLRPTSLDPRSAR
jgi:hypothetical protein